MFYTKVDEGLQQRTRQAHPSLPGAFTHTYLPEFSAADRNFFFFYKFI